VLYLKKKLLDQLYIIRQSGFIGYPAAQPGIRPHTGHQTIPDYPAGYPVHPLSNVLVYWYPVLRIRIRDPVLFYPPDPGSGSGMEQWSDPGSGIKNPGSATLLVP
jgi:hypothetical protein